jgi:hypothetical protein
MKQARDHCDPVTGCGKTAVLPQPHPSAIFGDFSRTVNFLIW